jgi:hypothetical protein
VVENPIRPTQLQTAINNNHGIKELRFARAIGNIPQDLLRPGTTGDQIVTYLTDFKEACVLREVKAAEKVARTGTENSTPLILADRT